MAVHGVTVLFGGQVSGEARERHYICKSRTERDQVVAELFRICFYADTIKWPLEYQVTKVTRSLLPSEVQRTYKITLDSLLILDDWGRIKKELPLMGIARIAEGQQQGAIRLEFKVALSVCPSPHLP